MVTIKKMSIGEMEEKTCAELREICKSFKITGMSKARKDVITSALSQFFNTSGNKAENKTEKSSSNSAPTGRIGEIDAKLHSVLMNNNTYDTIISVSCGAASSKYPVAGRTAGFVKATYREILNIETTSKSIVNGDEVSDNYVLQKGDVLEFVRQAGRKG